MDSVPKDIQASGNSGKGQRRNGRSSSPASHSKAKQTDWGQKASQGSGNKQKTHLIRVKFIPCRFKFCKNPSCKFWLASWSSVLVKCTCTKSSWPKSVPNERPRSEMATSEPCLPGQTLVRSSRTCRTLGECEFLLRSTLASCQHGCGFDNV